MIPAWVDRRECPFEPRTLDVDGGRLSYVDEGEGAPIVMVHGTPTWSFLYRHALLIWGMKDPAFGRDLGRWRGVFERAEVVELPDCGHAPPEERAPEALKRLAPFLERQGGEE